MKKIKEIKNTLGNIYLIIDNDKKTAQVNLQIIQKEYKSIKYLMMLNSDGRDNEKVFYFINYECYQEAYNSKLQSIQALKLLYSFSEIIRKKIEFFTKIDFNNFSRFILGQSIHGVQEDWVFITRRSISTHNAYMATIRKYYKHLNLSDKSIFDNRVVGVNSSSYGLLAHTRKNNEIKFESNISKMRNRKVPKYITKEEYKDINRMYESKNNLLSLRNRVIIDLMYLKGLRLGEVLGLTLEDVKEHPDNRNAGLLTIRNRISDKAYQHAKNSLHPLNKNDYKTEIYKERGIQKIVIPEGLKRTIDKYIFKSRDLSMLTDKFISNMMMYSEADAIETNQNNYYLFLSKNGTALTSSGWNYNLKIIFNELNIHVDEGKKSINLSHRFRHGYAMYLIKELNLSLEEVSRYMRHRSISSTYVYYNPTEEEILESSEIIESKIEEFLE